MVFVHRDILTRLGEPLSQAEVDEVFRLADIETRESIAYQGFKFYP